MTSLLEVLIAFVGVVLVLALAAQSLQEIVKHTFAIKSFTRITSLSRLLQEASVSQGFMRTDADEVIRQVLERLGRLGQHGVRPNRVRLDALTPDELAGLICSIDPERIPSLRGLAGADATKRLGDLAERVLEWYGLAERPVQDRYERRMRLGAIASALAVVLLVNASAFDVLDRLRQDPELRDRVTAAATELAEERGALTALADSVKAATAEEPGDSAVANVTPLLARLDSTRAAVDSLVRSQVFDAGLFPGPESERDWGELRWWFGIILSTLLVSLGAPFWHDILESIFGLKRKALGPPGGRRENGERPESA
jgi:hypothetical protein